MTAAGQLRDRIAFDAETVQPNGYGGTVSGWSEQFVVSARRQFLRGGEGVQSARLEGRQPVLLTVRRSSSSERITTEWRARDTRSDAVYNIRSIEPSEDRAWVVMVCEGGVAS